MKIGVITKCSGTNLAEWVTQRPWAAGVWQVAPVRDLTPRGEVPHARVRDLTSGAEVPHARVRDLTCGAEVPHARVRDLSSGVEFPHRRLRRVHLRCTAVPPSFVLLPPRLSRRLVPPPALRLKKSEQRSKTLVHCQIHEF